MHNNHEIDGKPQNHVGGSLSGTANMVPERVRSVEEQAMLVAYAEMAVMDEEIEMMLQNASRYNPDELKEMLDIRDGRKVCLGAASPWADEIMREIN